MHGTKPYIRFKYTGTALPTGATTVTLFSTVTAFPFANGLQMLDIDRLYFTIQNDQTGTLKAYFSNDRGTTWVRCFPDATVTASATNDENRHDYLVEPYADFKVDWTNGGSNQGTFNINIAGTDQRNVGA